MLLGRGRSGWRRGGRRIQGEFRFLVPYFTFARCDRVVLGWLANNTSLGMASFVLEMIPFASIAFSFSNAVGAALWAADIEKAIR